MYEINSKIFCLAGILTKKAKTFPWQMGFICEVTFDKCRLAFG